MHGFRKRGKGLQMSSDEIAIKVSALSKNYQMYERPGDRLKQFIYPRLARLCGKSPRQYFHNFWALKDISFEVKKGETLGIIGRNGSGKSTLLQLICGILNPTSGSVEINGRVAAILELGSGFNPEFTGRENIFLNASIYGLTNDEITDRLQRIIQFADIGDFVDQPVKTYSSGMLVRLAFAVIAHVDADILVIDEALAVGDAIFIQKCMRFIRKFQENGALIFVSHDISAVQNLCQTTIWLKKGHIEQAGVTKSIAEAYLQFTLQEIYGDEVKLQSSSASDAQARVNHGVIDFIENTLLDKNDKGILVVENNLDVAKGWRTGSAEVLAIRLKRLSGGRGSIFEGGERVLLSVEAIAHERLNSPIIGFLVRDRLGQDLFGENTVSYTTMNQIHIGVGVNFEGQFEFTLPMLPNGEYTLMVSVADGDCYDNVQHHWLHDALILKVSSSKIRYGLVGVQMDKVQLKISHA